MEFPVLVVILGLGMFQISAFAFPFAARNNNGVQGSRQPSISCDCESVEVWLRRNTASSSELIPSFEELTLMRESFQGNGEKLGKHLRLKPRKNCNLLLKKAYTNGVYSIKGKNTHDRSVEVWLVKNDSHCQLSMWMECQERLICVGLDLDTTDFIQLTKRKLLMIGTGDHKEITGFQTYSLVFTGLLLCVMVILVALCGASTRNRSHHSEIYSGDEDVEVVKSKKVKSVQQKDHTESEVVVEQENQDDLAKKVDQVDDVMIDRNSNRSSKIAADPDLDAVAIGEDEGETLDGQVQGDNQNKEKEKGKLKSKRKDKDMRSKRAHTVPEAKGGSSKIPRFSLKMHSRVEINQKQKPDNKKSKKKSASESASPLSSPTTPSSHNPFANRDRRSFIDRELPQRPTEVPRAVPTVDDNYAEPFDNVHKRETSDKDIEEDLNYEQVQNRTTSDVPVSARDEVRRSNRGPSSSAAAQPRISITNNEGEEAFYDSVDESKVVQSAGTLNNFSNNQNGTFDDTDTYESVADSINRNAPNAETFEETFYEVVESRNTQRMYENPNLSRKRSASDVTSPSPIFRESDDPKTKSLGRGGTTAATTTPPPVPPLENLPRHASSGGEHIDPYTMTRRSGDFIVQETSTNTSELPNALSGKRPQPTIAASQQELETMYARVDKDKQKRDRLESHDKDKQKEERVADPGKETDTADKPSSNDSVDEDEDEHNYECIPTLPRNSTKDAQNYGKAPVLV